MKYITLLGKYLKLKAEYDDLEQRYNLVLKGISNKIVDKMVEAVKIPDETKNLRSQNHWLRKKLKQKNDIINDMLSRKGKKK